MTGWNVRRAVLLGSLSATALFAAPVCAQRTTPEPAAASDQTDQDADIVVTAQKREQTLIDIPQSIQAISGAELERRGTKELGQLVNFIPGASVVSRAGPGQETIQIRGISSGTVGDATVGYYIDDIAFSIPNLQLAPPARLIDLERVEVLRGPQGTLYGNGALGGSIRLVTTRPDTEKWGGKIQGEVSGTEGGGVNYAVDGAVNVPIASDVAGLRVSGGYETLSGFADLPARGLRDVNGTNSYNIRGKLYLNPADNLTIDTSIWHINSRQNYNNLLVSANPPVAHDPGTLANPFIATVVTFYSGSIKWDLGPVVIESGTSFADHSLQIESVAAGAQNQSLFRTKSFNEELRIVSNTSSPFKWIVGGTYTDATITSDILVTVPALAGTVPLLATTGAPLTTRNFAFFGEVSYDLFGGKLVPLFGIRYFNDDRRASGVTSAPLLIGILAANPLTAPLLPVISTQLGFASGNGNFTAVSPRFNLAFKPNDQTSIYFNAARGFRSGTIQTPVQSILGQLSGVATNNLVNPDSLWSYELGTKLKLADNSLYLDGAVYYTDWSNIQIPFNTPFGLPATVNGGDARLYGVELTATWKTPLQGLTLQASGNINSSQYSRVDPALAASLAQARNGRQLPGVPLGNFTLGANYSTAINEKIRLNFNSVYAYRDRQQELASGLFSANLDQLSGRLGIETKAFKLDVFAENILNDLGPAASAANTQQPLYPRRVGVQLTAKY